jgi:hypothetical protein
MASLDQPKGLRQNDRARQPVRQFPQQGFVARAAAANNRQRGARRQQRQHTRDAGRGEGGERRRRVFNRETLDGRAQKIVPVERFRRRGGKKKDLREERSKSRHRPCLWKQSRNPGRTEAAPLQHQIVEQPIARTRVAGNRFLARSASPPAELFDQRCRLMLVASQNR